MDWDRDTEEEDIGLGALATGFPDSLPDPAVPAAAPFRAAPAGAALAAQAASSTGPSQRTGPGASLLARLLVNPPWPLPPPAAPNGLAPAGALGFFRAQHETVQPAFAHIRQRTPLELQGIIPHAMGLVFCHLRLAETTVPRSEKDDTATITALKAQKYLLGSGVLSR